MIKKIGFWKENGHPNEESIYDFMDSTVEIPRKLKWRFFFYLNNSPALSISLGPTECIIDQQIISGDVYRTDGIWAWNDNIIHYYEKHGYQLPLEFERYLSKKFIPYPYFFVFKKVFQRNLMNKISESIEKII